MLLKMLIHVHVLQKTVLLNYCYFFILMICNLVFATHFERFVSFAALGEKY